MYDNLCQGNAFDALQIAELLPEHVRLSSLLGSDVYGDHFSSRTIGLDIWRESRKRTQVQTD